MLVALDQGTTSTRAMVFDAANLAPLFTSQREFTQYYPQDGWVEHDAEEIWQDTCTALNEARDWVGANGGKVLALGITNQRETVVVWDRATGKPLHRAIVWQDRRTAARCEQLKAEGVQAWVNGKTGLLLDPYFSATKLAWLLDLTDLRERAAKGEVVAGTIDTFLLWRLTAGKVFATDVTNASRTQLCALASMDWDEELLSLHNIPRECLPAIKDCAADYGSTDLFGGSVPIGSVIGDQQAAAVGQACLAKGEAKSTYGTGSFVIVQGADKPLVPGNGLLGTVGYRVGAQKAYAMEGSIFVAGAAVNWLRDKMGLLEDPRESERMARAVRSTGGVYLVPAFTGMGAPHWQPAARASLVGMTLDTGRNEVVRATLEAVAYSTATLLVALAAEDVALTKLNIDGGMAKNDWFAQFLADITELKVSRPKCTESSATGAAFLAGLQVGKYANLGDINSLRQEDSGFLPAMNDTTRTSLLKGWDRAVQATLAHVANKG